MVTGVTTDGDSVATWWQDLTSPKSNQGAAGEVKS